MKHVSSMPMEMKKKMTVFSFSSDSSSLVKMRLSEMMTPAVPGGMEELLAPGPAEPHGSGTPSSQPPHRVEVMPPGVEELQAVTFLGQWSQLLADTPTPSLPWQCSGSCK